MKAWQKWLAATVAVFVGAWFIATLLGVVADQQDQRQSRAELVRDFEAQIAEVRADGQANKAALEEANRRCNRAEDCTPVPAPDPIDDAEVQDGEIQEPEIQEPEQQERERQDPEVQQDERPGADGAAGQSCVAELGLEQCRGPKGDTGDKGTDGKEGPAGPAGPVGTARPGTYLCPDGEYQRGLTITDAGDVVLACAPLPLLPIGGTP